MKSRTTLLLLSLLFTLSAFGQQHFRYNIEKIEYTEQAGDWEGCSFRFTINKDRTVDYIADSTYCGKTGKQQYLDTATYYTIVATLNKMDFPKWKHHYNYCIDCGREFLRITYNGGKTTITGVDGGEGPKDLLTILRFLYGLKDTQHWK